MEVPEDYFVKYDSQEASQMKVQPQQSDSLKKALGNSRTFDEAEYYKSKKVEMGGDDEDDPEIEEDDDDDYEEELPEEI